MLKKLCKNGLASYCHDVINLGSKYHYFSMKSCGTLEPTYQNVAVTFYIQHRKIHLNLG